MNLTKIAALALFGALAASAANAAVGAWSSVYTDKTNGIFVNEYSNLVSAGTPPLPLNYPGSRVVMSVSSVSGTAMSVTPWATLGGPIGTSATVTGVSASLLPAASVASSATTLTSVNSFHDVGMNVSNTTGQLYKVRVTEIKQQPL